MNKLSKILLVIIVVLLIALGVMTYGCLHWRSAFLRTQDSIHEALEKVGGSINIDDDGNITVNE